MLFKTIIMMKISTQQSKKKKTSFQSNKTPSKQETKERNLRLMLVQGRLGMIAVWTRVKPTNKVSFQIIKEERHYQFPLRIISRTPRRPIKQEWSKRRTFHLHNHSLKNNLLVQRNIGLEAQQMKQLTKNTKIRLETHKITVRETDQKLISMILTRFRKFEGASEIKCSLQNFFGVLSTLSQNSIISLATTKRNMAIIKTKII